MWITNRIKLFFLILIVVSGCNASGEAIPVGPVPAMSVTSLDVTSPPTAANELDASLSSSSTTRVAAPTSSLVQVPSATTGVVPPNSSVPKDDGALSTVPSTSVAPSTTWDSTTYEPANPGDAFVSLEPNA